MTGAIGPEPSKVKPAPTRTPVAQLACALPRSDPPSRPVVKVPELDSAALGGLMEMGFPEALCRNALLMGRNRFEPALEWLLSHAEDPAAAEPLGCVREAIAAMLRAPVASRQRALRAGRPHPPSSTLNSTLLARSSRLAQSNTPSRAAKADSSACIRFLHSLTAGPCA